MSNENTKQPLPRRRAKLAIGDCFEFDVPAGKFAYVRYLCPGKSMGHVIEVFDVIASEPIAVHSLDGAKRMFPPIFTHIPTAQRCAQWRWIGNLPVTDPEIPPFRSSLEEALGIMPPPYNDWHYTYADGRGEFVGELPPGGEQIEIWAIWPSDWIVDRILTGHPPEEKKPYQWKGQAQGSPVVSSAPAEPKRIMEPQPGDLADDDEAELELMLCLPLEGPFGTAAQRDLIDSVIEPALIEITDQNPCGVFTGHDYGGGRYAASFAAPEMEPLTSIVLGIIKPFAVNFPGACVEWMSNRNLINRIDV